MRFLGSAVALFLAVAVVGAYPAISTRETVTLTVDLGYEVYQGVRDTNNSIDVFKGIRYAAPPLGNLRFAAPQLPATNRSSVQIATSNPPICPQTGASKETPEEYGFGSAPGNEDCLYLNVYAPVNASNLPVFFWIHGGGYSLFSASGLDPTEIMTTNDNGFISVIIQYRLGAFGFLAGDDVKEKGTLNAGLLDMNFALQWVQRNIKSFGGDPSRVTLAGESAGAGAVMYQAMAYGGAQNQSLFTNIIAASPWVPYQHAYDDPVPSTAYKDFASAAGCLGYTDTLQCLRDADTSILQNASVQASEAGPFGTFAFGPVTDGKFVQQLPSEQLVSKNLTGKRILSANLANEGIPLSPPYTKTLEDFRAYINTTFPTFSPSDKAALEDQYSFDGDDLDVDPSSPLFQTDGTSLPSAINQSAFGTGQQQRVFNLFAEYAFDCPSYWLASAFPQAWKYQYSGPPSYHGYDLQALWSGTKSPGQSFKHAYRKIWGNFIIHDDPTITVADARAGNGLAVVPVGGEGKIEWPVWNRESPRLLSLNSTGGYHTFLNVTDYLKYYIYRDPGVVNQIKVADAYEWEGGRGRRCDWWLENAAKVPY
ncbi:alpha/beta-hydrolase [Massarina eburnea CBS 473.64]|uniref:Carboxylic ester hydrolase n=1 Tax=Massarina eburnea CBS 473.64 TaxID=1395130 RepID=A0A6A6S1I6_9PLEO|nr:alpha/beta-hydrolase [Massarina eburnea CBS 473.64]